MNGKYKNKKGSLLVEAAITLPIFIIVVVTLMLTINIISSCNNIVYQESLLIREISLDTIKVGKLSTLNLVDLYNKIDEEDIDDFTINRFRNGYIDRGYDNLVSIESTSIYNILNPLEINSKIEFSSNIVGRQFVGKYEINDPLPLERFMSDEGSLIVTVFPRYGIRYHDSNCKYITEYKYDEIYMEAVELYEAELRGYTPCLVCGG